MALQSRRAAGQGLAWHRDGHASLCSVLVPATVGMGMQNPCLVFAHGDTGDLEWPGVSWRTEAVPVPLPSFPLTRAGEQPRLLETREWDGRGLSPAGLQLGPLHLQ